jgi:hypothetical protein
MTEWITQSINGVPFSDMYVCSVLPFRLISHPATQTLQLFYADIGLTPTLLQNATGGPLAPESLA